MMIDEKDNALYVKACVIPANEEDSQGDTLSSEDIKRIFTSYDNNSRFEVYHHGDQIDGVTLLENYINKAEEPIGDRVAPGGSWLIIMKVTNPTIKEMVLSHEFEGVSLSSTVKQSCGLNLPDITTYADVRDMECVTPQFISLVGRLGTDEGPANGYPLEVMNYTTYIKKSKNGGKKLEVKEIITALKDLVTQAESVEPTEVEAPVILKNDEPQEEEKKEEEAEVNKEECPKDPEVKKESESTEESEPVVNKEDTPTAEEETVEEESENNTDDDSARIAALEEKVAELEKAIEALKVEEPEAEETVEEEIVEEEVKPKINKSKKTIITEDPKPAVVANFNERTGRDSFGRKIRK